MSPATDGFVTDVAVNHLVSIIQSFDFANGNMGIINFVTAGTMMYALAPNNGKGGNIGVNVAAFDIVDGIKDVQNFPLAGADANAQGMAV